MRRSFVLPFALALLTCRAGPAGDPNPDGRACRKDADCVLAASCLGCNQCLSRPPAPPGALDCAAKCIPDPSLACRCAEGRCVAWTPEAASTDAGAASLLRDAGASDGAAPALRPDSRLLAQVNETPCTSNADCSMTTLHCQCGCCGEPVNTASPLFAQYERQRLAADPCCRPGINCVRTKCAQRYEFPACRDGRCVLQEEPPARLFLSARASHQCLQPAEEAQLVARETARLGSLAVDVRLARGLFGRQPDACRPADPERFFGESPWAGRDVWLEAQREQCEACKCFAPLYFCVKSPAPTEDLKRLGYAPVSR